MKSPVICSLILFAAVLLGSDGARAQSLSLDPDSGTHGPIIVTTSGFLDCGSVGICIAEDPDAPLSDGATCINKGGFPAPGNDTGEISFSTCSTGAHEVRAWCGNKSTPTMYAEAIYTVLEPTLAACPRCGPPRSTGMAFGKNYRPSVRAKVSIGGFEVLDLPPYPDAADGSFAASFTVPDLPPGDYEMVGKFAACNSDPFSVFTDPVTFTVSDQCASQPCPEWQKLHIVFGATDNAKIQGIDIEKGEFEDAGLRNEVVNVVKRTFQAYDVLVTSDLADPTPTGDYSTVWVGSSLLPTPWDQDGNGCTNIYGISDGVDYGNPKPDDNAFVFSDRLPQSSDLATSVAAVVAHEAGHLFGLAHVIWDTPNWLMGVLRNSDEEAGDVSFSTKISRTPLVRIKGASWNGQGDACSPENKELLFEVDDNGVVSQNSHQCLLANLNRDPDATCGGCVLGGEEDSDCDGQVDRLDPCPFDRNCKDSDTDGFLDSADNCPDDPNPDQADNLGNGIGNACDPNCSPNPDGSYLCSPPGRDCSAAPMRESSAPLLLLVGLAALAVRRLRWS